MKRAFSLSLGVMLLLAASQALAQGVLIVIDPPYPVPLPRPYYWMPPRPPRPPVPPPEPPASYKIKELALQARIVDQVARVQVSQSFVNTGSRLMEVAFVFPLPYDGAVDQLTFMVDGKEIPAKLLPAAEARSIYEGYVRRNQDPALLEWIGTGMFKTSVFPVPPGAERKVNLRYNQLLRKDGHVTDFLFPLSTAKYTSAPVERVLIEASIESAIAIKSVYSPTHTIDVKRSDDRHATIRFELQNQVPATDFRLFYDVAKGEVGASVLSYRPASDDDGYFLLLASPQIKADAAERPAKTTIFVVDRSGSMSGKKMEQAKEALKFVLNNLRQGDTFNIIAYDSSVESFRPELQKYDEETRKAALGFIEGIYAGGSTNIDGALSTALEMIQDAKRPGYVIFLTDGLPTAGETNEAKIVDRARQRNKYRTRVVNLGVGYDVNSRLLDRLSRANYGQSEFVRPDEDLEAHVSRLHNRISAPGDDRGQGGRGRREIQGRTGSADQSRLSARGVRLVRGRATGAGRPVQAAGPCEDCRAGEGGRQAEQVRFPGRIDREEQGRILFVRREAVGHAADRGDHRRVGLEGQERGVDSGTGGVVDQARHSDAVHFVPGRRESAAATGGRRDVGS